MSRLKTAMLSVLRIPTVITSFKVLMGRRATIARRDGFRRIAAYGRSLRGDVTLAIDNRYANQPR